MLFVLRTSQLAFRRRLLCPFVLGALKQRCPRNVASLVCVCLGVDFVPLSCLGVISVVGVLEHRSYKWCACDFAEEPMFEEVVIGVPS